MAPDQGVNITFCRFCVQIDAVFFQRGFFFIAFGYALGFFFVLGCACDGSGLAVGRIFGDAMRDIVDRVVAGHVLFLQKVCRVAFTLCKDGDQHVGACDLGPARGLHVDGGTLDDALEGGCWNGL